MEQEQIDKVILDYEQHVCAKALAGGASAQDCDVSNWPPLTTAKETLSQLLREITVHATFGSVRLTNMVWGAWHTMMTYVPPHATQDELIAMWTEKIQAGAPAHDNPDFKKWMYEVMALIVCFLSKIEEDEIFLMRDNLDYTQDSNPIFSLRADMLKVSNSSGETEP